jgi:predicted SAM-dependent methyltransferase
MKLLNNLLFRILRKTASLAGYDLKREPASDVHDYVRLYGKESVKERRFYNLSAGAYLGFGGGLHHPCWTNIDLDRTWEKTEYHDKQVEFNPEYDIAHDLLSLEPIPVESSAAELVHTRFTIASLTNEAAQYMFKEVHRMLKDGGIFRISVPNIDLDYRAYLDNDITFFYWFGDTPITIEQAFLFHVATQLSSLSSTEVEEKLSDTEFREILENNTMQEALDQCAGRCSLSVQRMNRQDHINWWNSEKLENMLHEAGFSIVYPSAPEQSASPVMRNETYFDNEDNRFVMYMEAMK